MGRRGLAISLAGVLVAAGAVVVGVWALGERHVAHLTDGAAIDTLAQDARARDVLWSPPEVVSLGVDGFAPAVSALGGEVVFARGTPGEDVDLWVAQREGDGWGEARELAALNTGYDELDPAWLADGSGIVFASDRPGGAGGYDLWIAEREGNEWAAPRWLGASVNGPLHEFGPSVSGDQLWFASNRPTAEDGVGLDEAGDPVRVRAELFDRVSDLYKAPMDGDRVGVPVRIAELSSDASEVGPAVSPAGDFVYFASDRAATEKGDFDLYRARILEHGFGAVEAVGAPVATVGGEVDPSLGAGGFELWYLDTARNELRRSVSKEVYRRMVAQRAEIDWTGWLRDHWVMLLALALLIALIATILMLLADTRARSRWGTLSLMARCVLASVFVHLLLAALFAAWQVKTSLEGLLDGGGPTRVALVSSAGQSGLAGQLRGATTAVTVAPAAASALSSAAAVAPAPVAYEQSSSVAAGADVPEMTMAAPRTTLAQGVSASAQRVEMAGEAPSLPDVTTPAAAGPGAPELAKTDGNEAALAWAPVGATAAPSAGAASMDAVMRGVDTNPAATLADAGEVAEASLDVTSGDTRLADVEGADSVEIAMAMDDELGSIAGLEAPEVGAPGVVAEPEAAAEGGLRIAAAEASAVEALQSDLASVFGAPARIETDPGARVAETELADTSLDVSDLGGADLGMEELELAAIDVGELAPLALAAPDIDLPEAVDPVSLVRGVVVHDDTGTPIEGAVVRLDRAGAEPLETRSDARGRFAIEPGDLPDFFAISATKEGFTPGAKDMSAGAVEAGAGVEIRLSPESFAIIALEDEPRVHHLGNDRYDGRVNSQFQRESEGVVYRATFTLGGRQALESARSARVLMLLKGAQVGNPVFVNGNRLPTLLDDSPNDGSYREESLAIPLSALVDGENVLEIHSVKAPGTDIDDFEFVNVRIELELGEPDGSVSL